MAINDNRIDSRFENRRDKARKVKAGLPGEDEQPLPPPVETIRTEKGGTVGRNDPCPCGSGKKYKKCCGK
jgi:uncharacterized protein YecA (UPF0149 family)